jgi:hypothetical protein
VNVDSIKTVAGARPFLPFTIHTADGDHYHVSHPELIGMDLSARTIFVGGQRGGFAILDRKHITRLVVDDGRPEPEANGS